MVVLVTTIHVFLVFNSQSKAKHVDTPHTRGMTKGGRRAESNMRIIELDARPWNTVLDFCDALCSTLGSPEWHGRGIDAFIDSMIWGGIDEVEPPYTVRIRSVSALPEEVRVWIEDLAHCIAEAREEYRIRNGRDIEVQFEFVP